MASSAESHLSARSSSSFDSATDSSTIAVEGETEKLLWTEEYGPQRPQKHHRMVQYLWASNILFVLVSFVLAARLITTRCRDPSLTVYSPANEAVTYIPNHQFQAALGHPTEYMGFPDDETDKRWEALFQYNRSVITKEEAKHLSTPTMAAPGTEDYLVELEVYHNLHCFNELRKLLWPERYRMLERLTLEDGTINRTNFGFRHWDHCVDSLRQSLTCNADVSPISWHVNVPFNRGIYSRLATTYTCRDFSQIQKWASEHQAPAFEQRIYDFAEIQRVIDGTDIDHSTEEDLQDQYMLFPGDKWFKYWREHTYQGEVGRPQVYPTRNHTFGN